MGFRGVVSGCKETRDAIKVCFMTRELTSQKNNSHCVLVRASRWVGMEWELAESWTSVDVFASACAMCRGPCGKPCFIIMLVVWACDVTYIMHRLYCFLPPNAATVFRTNIDGCVMRRCAQAVFNCAARSLGCVWFVFVRFFQVAAGTGFSLMGFIFLLCVG